MVEITTHAKGRMRKYRISKNTVVDAVLAPDGIVRGHSDRKIYQKKLNGYVLRVIVEESINTKKVITVYKSRSYRYEI